MARKFRHVSPSTGSDDGLWMSWDGENHTMCVIEFARWEDLDSSAVAEYGKYNVQAGTVDLSPGRPCNGLSDGPTMSCRTVLVNALRCCGLEFCLPAGAIVDEHSGEVVCRHDDPALPYVLAECYWRYGEKDVDSDESGDNRAELMRRARANF